MTGAVMTSSTGVSGSALNATRRVMSCSVTMPTGRPLPSVTVALEASSAARRSITRAQGMPASTARGTRRMKSLTSLLNIAV